MQLLAIFHTSILQHLKKSVRDYKVELPNRFRAEFVLNDVRKGGGGFAKMEKAKEDEYFYNKTKNDIEKMSMTNEEKLKYVQDQIDKRKGDVRQYEKILEELQQNLKGSK